MKKTVEPNEIPAIWAAEALYLKAQRYTERMSSLDTEEWDYALWSGFSLEFLGRAALSNVSPALLAECDKSWTNLYHALGFPVTTEKFSPKSITISETFKRLTIIIPNFTKEHENFGILHTGRRNSELHSGELAFDGIKNSKWQAQYYDVCSILLESMGMALEDLLGADEAKVARQLIAAAADKSAQAIKGEMDAHQRVWNSKSEEEKVTLQSQAMVWATRNTGHRVKCPACSSPALVVGEPASQVTRKINDGEIVETQEYLPSHFECVACGFRISGLSRLTVVGLSDRYKKTSAYDIAEFYDPDEDADYYGYEDDNNEP